MSDSARTSRGAHISTLQGDQENLFDIIAHLEERPGATYDGHGGRLAPPATWQLRSALLVWRMLDNTLCNATVDLSQAHVAFFVKGHSGAFDNVNFVSTSPFGCLFVDFWTESNFICTPADAAHVFVMCRYTCMRDVDPFARRLHG
jgi:hypothetical protein